MISDKHGSKKKKRTEIYWYPGRNSFLISPSPSSHPNSQGVTQSRSINQRQSLAGEEELEGTQEDFGGRG